MSDETVKRMTSTTVYLPEETLEALRALSKKTGVPFAAIVRSAILEALKKRGVKC